MKRSITRTRRTPSAQISRRQAASWRNSDTLFLLNCYDVWSATPPRGCDCRSYLPAAT